jgi:hypothetical protein
VTVIVGRMYARTPIMCVRCWVIALCLSAVLGLLTVWLERRRSRRHYARGLAYLEVLNLQRPVAGDDLVRAFDPRLTGERDRMLDEHRERGEG